jgi:RHS repeat-associated protein
MAPRKLLLRQALRLTRFTDPFYPTGQPRDPETGLDFFGARFYSSTLGRFLTPDWAAQAEPVPYAQLDNPQSLNLYTYVLNNPVTSVDKDGHVDNDGNGPIDRVIVGAEGVFNLTVGVVEAGGAAGSTAFAPETFDASLAGTAYLGVRAAGSIAAGGAQIIGAVMGHVKEGRR